MFVLTMPIAAGRDDIALLAFLGGFSSATSMVIVSCIALSTMISNHIVMPLVLRRTAFSGSGGDLRKFLLKTRRVAICGILLVGFLYLEFGPQAAGLASIGLVAFAGVAQVMPAMIGRRRLCDLGLYSIASGFAGRNQLVARTSKKRPLWYSGITSWRSVRVGKHGSFDACSLLEHGGQCDLLYLRFAKP